MFDQTGRTERQLRVYKLPITVMKLMSPDFFYRFLTIHADYKSLFVLYADQVFGLRRNSS